MVYGKKATKHAFGADAHILKRVRSPKFITFSVDGETITGNKTTLTDAVKAMESDANGGFARVDDVFVKAEVAEKHNLVAEKGAPQGVVNGKS